MIGFLKKGLQKTIERVKAVVPVKQEKISKETIEEILIEADVGYSVIEELLEPLPKEITREKLEKALLSLFKEYEPKTNKQKPFVELIVGVNGAGKTTTIAKLAKLYKDEGVRVMLGAGDTFRAAAIEQIKIWAAKLDIPVIYTKQGHDPSGVAFDTIASAIARGFEHVIIDTAGRLHTQVNLAGELKKITRVCDKALPGAPHRKILILDGTQGSSALNQAKAFDEMIGIDGIIITKLDGTAKGGSLFGIAKEMKVPILYVGVGEGADDLVPFNPKEFVDDILDEIYNK